MNIGPQELTKICALTAALTLLQVTAAQSLSAVMGCGQFSYPIAADSVETELAPVDIELAAGRYDIIVQSTSDGSDNSTWSFELDSGYSSPPTSDPTMNPDQITIDVWEGIDLDASELLTIRFDGVSEASSNELICVGFTPVGETQALLLPNPVPTTHDAAAIAETVSSNSLATPAVEASNTVAVEIGDAASITAPGAQAVAPSSSARAAVPVPALHKATPVTTGPDWFLAGIGTSLVLAAVHFVGAAGRESGPRWGPPRQGAAQLLTPVFESDSASAIAD